MSSPPPTTSSTFPIHISSVHYTNPPSNLQTLDIWLPRPLSQSPPESTVWIIYIHGGAWRDPLQTSSCILPTLTHLSKPSASSTINRIAGIASINYRLSQYPSHPTHPSSPDDSDRNVKHPVHIQDVAAAIRWLHAEYNVGEDGGKGYKWLGIGHSCGATLLAQLASGIGLNHSGSSSNEEAGEEEGRVDLNLNLKPTSLILLEGIYSLPLFMKNHTSPHCPAAIEAIYRDILVGAFGPENADANSNGGTNAVWTSASPTSASYTTSTYPAGRLTIIAHSKEDELVEEDQVHVMFGRLVECGWAEGESEGDRIVEKHWLRGKHDEIWEDGGQVAELISNVIGRWDEICR